MSSKGNSGNKIRLDILVSKLNPDYSRSLAKELILNGNVTVDDKIITSPGASFVAEDVKIICKHPENLYVGRGGYKIEKALEFFNIDVQNLICADIGASTGGFTDCLLKNGAKKVYAIDNGTGQLDNRLLNDSRVINMENINAKELSPDMFSDAIDFICIDVSFISVTKIIDAVSKLIKVGGYVICLIKPQFETVRKNISKKGIVKNPKVHNEVLGSVQQAFLTAGLSLIGHISSPITGADGNVEYLGCFTKQS
jgi:23S rRNA (cytidine1920-2'-O)/16S rRNA (cytidine1409-2'-O)-methyltransferase